MMTVEIPRTGYFVVGPDGQLRPEERPHHAHVVPDPPADFPALSDTVQPRNSFRARPVKSFIVEALHSVQESGGIGGDAAFIQGLHEWLEGHHLIEAVELVKDSPWAVSIRYRVTPRGQAFLAEHEAPIYW